MEDMGKFSNYERDKQETKILSVLVAVTVMADTATVDTSADTDMIVDTTNTATINITKR